MSILGISKRKIKVLPIVWGLGGRNVTVDEQINLYKHLFRLKNKNEYPADDAFQQGTYWLGLKTGA